MQSRARPSVVWSAAAAAVEAAPCARPAPSWVREAQVCPHHHARHRHRRAFPAQALRRDIACGSTPLTAPLRGKFFVPPGRLIPGIILVDAGLSSVAEAGFDGLIRR